MTINVRAGAIDPSHVFSLSDGKTKIGFLTCDARGVKSVLEGFGQSPMPQTPMKISQGDQGYEDFELPFTSIEMKDWSGGMLQENFETDRSKYRDGRYVDTTRGDIICGPKETQSTEFTGLSKILSHEYDYDLSIYKGTPLYSKYVADDDYTLYNIVVRSTGYTKMYAAIYSDDGGEPDELLAEGEKTVTSPGIYPIYLDEEISLEDGTTYWIELYSDPSLQVTTKVYMRDETDADILKFDTSTGSGYIAVEEDRVLAYKMTVSDDDIGVCRFFEYQRGLYCVRSFDNGTNPKLYLNGWRGAAKSNSADLYRLNTGLNLTGKDLSGCIALIIAGPGQYEEQPWRTIVSNTTTGTDDTCLVDMPWKTAHTTATGFVILGSDEWTEIASHGLTGKVSDVCVCRNQVLFALGSAINIRKFNTYNNSGTWTNQFKDDSTNKADFLLVVANTEGNLKIWKALIGVNQVDYDDALPYDTDNTYEGKDINIGVKSHSKITGMTAYGDPLIPYIFKEDSFGSIDNDIYAEVPIGEMKSIRSEHNGNASMMHGVYLYFNLEDKIERFYDRRMDDVGPDKDEGLPETRQGIVRKLLPYPGRYYALLYSDDKVSSILCNSGYGWHEIWRGTELVTAYYLSGEGEPYNTMPVNISGRRSNDMIVQVIPGTAIDRLWFDWGGQIMRIPIAMNPRKDSNYEYRDLSQLTTSWIYGNLKDVNKYWHSIKLHTENLSGSESTDQTIMVEYRVDNDENWTRAGYVDTSPIEELDLSTEYNVSGHRIQFRFTLHTEDETKTPRIVAVVVKGVIRVDVKKGWSARVLTQPTTDLNENPDTQTDILAKLDEWADSELSPVPLTMRHNIDYYDNKKVFIDPASLKMTMVELNPTPGRSTRKYQEIASFTMYEV